MKKCKLALIGCLCVLSFGILAGCGNRNNEETGSNTDSGNNTTGATGVIEEVVTDAATGVKEVVTDAGTMIKDAASGAADIINDAIDNNNTTNDAEGTEHTTER